MISKVKLLSAIFVGFVAVSAVLQSQQRRILSKTKLLRSSSAIRPADRLTSMFV